MTRTRSGLVWRMCLAAGVAAVLLILASGVVAQPVQGQPAGQDEFVPVKQLPAAEPLPAAPFVLYAYAFVWVVILGYLWTIWRRLGQVRREILALERRVSSGGSR